MMMNFSTASRLMVVPVALMFLAMGALAAQAMDLTGSYTAKGRNPDGSAYSGKVVIIQLGKGISMSWQIGDQRYKGEGQLLGKVVEVNWGQKTPVVYVVRGDGSLHGTWSDGEALEKLTLVE